MVSPMLAELSQEVTLGGRNTRTSSLSGTRGSIREALK
jgi:hypothetical protein